MKKEFTSAPLVVILIVSTVGFVGCTLAPKVVGPIHPALLLSEVTVFEPPLIPKHYIVVAKLDATGYGGWSSQGVDQLILRRLRKQAALLGANGVLLTPVGGGGFSSCVPFGSCAFSHSQVHAEAIYVPH